MGSIGLGLLAVGLPLGCSTGPSPSSSERTSISYKIPPWTGDDPRPMHQVRDNRTSMPIPKPSRFYDLVIVGGGLSGLTAAYQLRNERFLLLERETALGGNAKQGEFGGIPYALGSAYLVDIEEPFASFYQELGIPLKPVPPPADMGFLSGSWQPLDAGPVAADFDRLRKQLEQMLERPDFPVCPIRKASSTALRLDKMSFYDYLKTDYSADLLRCIDAYCRSSLGGGIREVSAYAGINFYSEIAGNIYAFPGGNAFIARQLAKKADLFGSGRVETGASVYHIEQRPGEVRISYFHGNNPNKPVTVASKALILAIPYFFAARILKDLPAAPRQLMQSLQYGSYLVANCCFNQRVFHGGYDNWAPSSDSFTDFVIADYGTSVQTRHPGPKERSVLTVYAPLRNAQEGRTQLLRQERSIWAKPIADGLEATIAFPAGSLEEVRLTRYGHQMLTSRVGLIQSLARLPKRIGRVVLSHSDGQGMASIESAILEGLHAAIETQSILRSP